MVLFLRHDPRDAANPWRPAGIFREGRTPVAWLDGDQVSAVDQPPNPGPAGIHPLEYVTSRNAFRALVAYDVSNQRVLEAARAVQDPDRRVAALEEQVLAVRGLRRNLPAVDADRRIGSLSARCDRVLQGAGTEGGRGPLTRPTGGRMKEGSGR